ncbi:DUF1559 domain-containing protein [Singulisphaera sp. PoT]|uniref:DUF1559 family PulG-like putative transporter n=1 Tax=Singulisphaera sp. PoT TaxID=3411797 RepID=UPI003BF4B95E
MRLPRMTIERWLITLALPIVTVAGALRIRHGIELRHQDACVTNLKYIGLALHNYHLAYGRFPSGSLGGPSLPPDRRLGWPVTIFVFITQGLQLVYDPLESWDSPPNVRPQFMHTSTDGEPPPFLTLAKDSNGYLRCPSDRSRPKADVTWPTSYIGVAGLGRDAAALPSGHPRAGVFGDDRSTRLDEIKDGASTTMMLVETTTAVGPWNAGGPASVRGLDPARKPYIGPGRQFGGAHHGKANVMFADGSVRFISATINTAVFRAMTTIAGGEDPNQARSHER